jgi:hypothetical protein
MPFLRWLWQVGTRLLVSVDVALGALTYSSATLLFGKGFDAAALALALAAGLAPDLDMVPFLLLRRRCRLTSHRRVGHHPLLTLPLAATLGWSLAARLRPGDRAYWAVLAVAAMAAHYLHDSVHSVGLHWLSPFSWRYLRLGRRGFEPVPEDAVQAFFAARRQARQGREAWAEQIVSRLAEPGWTELLWLLAALVSLLIAFLVEGTATTEPGLGSLL